MAKDTLRSIDTEFAKKWQQAVQNEDYGHNFYYIKEYLKAAEMHLQSSTIFKDLSSQNIDEDLKMKSLKNHLIECGNFFLCKASHEFYNNKNYDSAHTLFGKAVEKIKDALKIVSNSAKNKKELDLITMNLHFLLERVAISKAFILMNRSSEQYNEIEENFKKAIFYETSEQEFAMNCEDFERARSIQARLFYCEGQIQRNRGIEALQKGNIKQAKEYYLKANEFFQKSANIEEKWEEYKILAKKMLNVANKLVE